MPAPDYEHETSKQNAWGFFVDKLYKMQTKIIQFVEQILYTIEWPEPHVDAVCMHHLWSEHKSGFVQHFKFLTDNKNPAWCDEAAERLVITLDRSTNLYLEIIFYYYAYTDNWRVHSETLTPNIRHLANILRNDIIATISGALPVHHAPFKHTLMYDLTKHLFIWWSSACLTEIICFDKNEFAMMQLAFAMITHPMLSQNKYAVNVDTHIIEYIFSIITNQACSDYTAFHHLHA